MKRILVGSMLFLTCWTLSGCGGGGGEGVDARPQQTGPPAITTQPASQTVTAGPSATFTVVATGTGPLHYQWKNGNAGVGTDSASFTIASAQAADAGSYTVTVTNAAGSVTSSPAILTVNPSGSIIAPDDPGAADLRFGVYSAEERKPVSPLIYGINFYDGASPRNLTLTRLGGNRWTAYNWENNASNSGTDWGPYSNDSYLGGGNTPGEAVRPTIQSGRDNGFASLITLQLQGYASADKNGLVDPNSGNYLQTRFKQVAYRKGSAFTTTPDTGDGTVYMDEFVNFLKSSFPADLFTHASTPLLFSFDNEPELWSGTHDILQPTRPTPGEYMTRFSDLAKAVKAVAPDAKIFGPVHYGFNGMVNWQNAPGFTNSFWFTDKFLQEMKSQSDARGHRLLDAYDFHWYSEAQGGGQRVINLTGASLTDAQANAVIQAPRSLYDGSYREAGWVADYLNAPINLLPRIQAKIDAAYPGTKIAITEYGHGGDRHIAGAIAQADTLGVFGKLGVYAATLWPLGNDLPFIYAGFKMFRDFDANRGSFGDTSIRATNPDWSQASLWASVTEGSDNRVVMVLINKTSQSRTAGLQLHHTRRLRVAEVYELSGADPVPQRRADIELILVNAFRYTMPPRSVTTLLLKP